MNYVEQCLYNYCKNLALIKNLKTELLTLQSLHGASYEGHAINSIANPVFDVTARIISLEKKIMANLKRTRPVARLCGTLTCIHTLRHSQMAGILKLRYFRHYSVNRVIHELAISQPTYWRRNDELLRKAREYLSQET